METKFLIKKTNITSLIDLQAYVVKLDLKNLKSHLNKMISIKFTIENVLESIKQAAFFDLGEVVTLALIFITNNKKECKSQATNMVTSLIQYQKVLASLISILMTDETIDFKLPEMDPQIENESMSSRMEDLFQSEKSTNFILRAENKDIKCHKAILGCRSDFFYSMLSSNMSEVKKGMMTFLEPGEDCGMSFTALHSLIRYLYTNQLNHLNDHSDCLMILSNQEYLLLSHEPKHSTCLEHCKKVVEESQLKIV